MPRFFLPSSAFSEDTVTLSGDDAHHISFALRAAVGDELTVCDMKGCEHLCRITEMDGKTVTARILSSARGETESPVTIRLYQGYPKGDKLETIIQKAVELGAASVTPFESERCIKRPKADRAERIAERQNRIATEAAKQCGRSLLPTVGGVLSFEEMIREATAAELCLFCYEGDGTTPITDICRAHPDVREIAVIVGCEGGFSSAEAEAIRQAGGCLTGLGRRILRCETAPLFALSVLSALYEL